MQVSSMQRGKEAYFSPLKTEQKKRCVTVCMILLFFSVAGDSSILFGLVLMKITNFL